MTDQAREQARQLLGTIMQLQRRVLVRTARKNLDRVPPAKDLTMPQMTTLLVIREHGELSLKEIAAATRVSPPSASTMVDRLVELGMATRRNSETDRREVRVAISVEGEKTVEVLEGELLESLTEIMDKIGPDYARRWCDVYGRIQDFLDDETNTRTVTMQDAVDGAL